MDAKLKMSELVDAVSEFLSGSIEEADFSARYIVSEVCGLAIPELSLFPDRILDESESRRIFACARRRSDGEPLQYIFGKAYFRELALDVGTGVLIPRPETELIVSEAVANLPKGGLLCETGAGSGAISLAIASERPDCKVLASELSDKALQYARKNRKKLGIKNARFFKGDLLSPFRGRKFDAIVANLPYVRSADIPRLPCEIRRYEPVTALDGGKDGLDIVRRFFRDAPGFAKDNAFVIAEISPEQFPAMLDFLRELDAYSAVKQIKDLSGRNRFLAARAMPCTYSVNCVRLLNPY